MRFLFFQLLLITSGLIAQAQAPAWQDKTRVLPEMLRQIPDGIVVWDSPNPSYPEPDSANPKAYVWRHDTHAMATKEDLTVVAAGSFIWYSEAGWQANISLSPAELAENFHCPNAMLKAGKTYIYRNNNRTAPNEKQLYGGDALWYVIAIDKEGKRYKGITLVETEPNVKRPKKK